MEHKYTDYKDVDQKQLEIDIDNIKNTIGNSNQSDYKHLLKLQLWGRLFKISGFLLIILLSYFSYISYELNIFLFVVIFLTASFFISIANVSRWANIAHPILHGAYDKVPNIPKRYTKDGFANKSRRYIDWLDWIKPDAWAYEHNIMHHYHLGENDDPDNVAHNLEWLANSKMPIFIKYIFIYSFATVWKIMYYAPNTLRILENKRRKKLKLKEANKYEINPFTKNGLALWKDYILPYGIFNFILLPLLFLPFGYDAVLIAFLIILCSEILANLHSFLVIVPNHTADDIYQFSSTHKTQGEYYLRQIMGSVNYNTGNDFIDFSHGFLNYQIEHHLFPNMPLSFYQKMQPIVKDICKKHNLEYRQDSVFKRMKMTIDLMIGKTNILRLDGI